MEHLTVRTIMASLLRVSPRMLEHRFRSTVYSSSGALAGVNDLIVVGYERNSENQDCKYSQSGKEKEKEAVAQAVAKELLYNPLVFPPTLTHTLKFFFPKLLRVLLMLARSVPFDLVSRSSPPLPIMTRRSQRRERAKMPMMLQSYTMFWNIYPHRSPLRLFHTVKQKISDG